MKTVIFIFILLAGFVLRGQNLDFPSIGYHDMRENEYLSMAQEMKRSGDLASKRVYFHNGLADEPGLKKDAEIPLVSYQILGAWRVFGENLWGGRLVNIFFGLSGIALIYLIAGMLFVDSFSPFFCALSLAVMPLAVFFSRNLQPEAPGLFFMLLGSFFYFKYITGGYKKYHLFSGSLFFAIAGLYQYNFLFGILPFLLCLPYRDIFRDKASSLKFLVLFFGPHMLALFALLWLFKTQAFMPGPSAFERMAAVFYPDYWIKYARVIGRYTIAENFTPVLALFAFAGIVIAFFKPKQLISRYLIGWILVIAPYFMLFSDNLPHQSYFQTPFAALVCIACGYTTAYLKSKSRMVIFVVFMTVAALGAVPFILASLKGMHATVFPGLDVAGESLKRFTKADERVFLYSHAQGSGIARYASRYMGWPDNLDDFKDKEAKLKIRYVCFYPASYAYTLKEKDIALFNYIKDNYRLAEAGLTTEPYQLFYLILENGRAADTKDFLEDFSGPPSLRTIYKMFDRYIFFYSVRPPSR